MVSTLLILAVASAALILVWTLLRDNKAEIHSVQDWDEKKNAIDVQIFRLLLDPNEELYLRNSLSHKDFHHYQRRRIRLALRMLALVEANTGMLLRLGQLAKMKGDPVLVQKADEMIAAAVHLRFNLLLAGISLSAKWLYPTWNLGVPTIAERYQQLLDSLAYLRQGHNHLPA